VYVNNFFFLPAGSADVLASAVSSVNSGGLPSDANLPRRLADPLPLERHHEMIWRTPNV
jgi:hypothetical protein